MSDDDIRILVKEWLQSQNRKSYQLAEEIGIRPQTFYAQMSVRKISANTKKAGSRQNTPMACGTMPRFRPHRTYLVYCTR